MTVLDSERPTEPVSYGRRRLVVLAVVLALLAGLGLAGKTAYDKAFGVPDYEGTGSGAVLVQVQPGDSAADVGATLVAKNVVRSVKAFTRAAEADRRSRGIQPGFYELRLRMSGASALALLLDPASRVRGRVTLPEGIPLSQVVERLVESTELKRADVLAALGNPAVLGLPSWAKNRPEGFLFPATYDIEPGTTAVEALQQMTDKFAEVAASLDLEANAARLDLTPYEALTIASLVEAETAVPGDRGKVARVILNRLAKGMKLELDSTVNYLRSEKTLRLTLKDLEVDSPYNTYKVTGLPPTPVAAPGEASLEAALNPAEGDWLYFVRIDKAGNSFFTDDYQEFLRAKAKAKRDGAY